jgi:CSLREA domain-containing protein
VITVTTAVDDLTPNDGSVSLREAIQAINNGTAGADMDISNQNPGAFGVNDTINFNLSAAGTVQTINVGSTGNSALPQLLKPVTINGYSEQGAGMNTLASGDNAKILIELNGADAGPNADGLLVGATGAGSTIEGLAINRFSRNGIELQGGSDTITGNYIGTDATGSNALGNAHDGIDLFSGANTVGGVAPAQRNVISGNGVTGIVIQGAGAGGNVVSGNYIGTDAAGTSALGNGGDGIYLQDAANTAIGGAAAGAGNVISGNHNDGFYMQGATATGTTIQGNMIGTNALGTSALGNGVFGL